MNLFKYNFFLIHHIYSSNNKIALAVGLSENFAEVSVEVAECPDLTAAPFHLASSGLSGSQTIVEVEF